MRKHSQHNNDERTQLGKYTSHTLFEMVAKGLRKDHVWEVSWSLNKTATYWSPALLAIAALLSRSAGRLNRGSWGLTALRWVLVLSTASYLQFDRPQTLNSLNFLSHRVISLFDIHLLPVSVTSAHNSTCPQSRLYPDIFDRMHQFLDRRLGRGSLCYKSMNSSVLLWGKIVVQTWFSNLDSRRKT